MSSPNFMSFEPCNEDHADSFDLFEDHARVRLASPRWYNTGLRISDGCAMTMTKGGWINNATTNNCTIEYFPPKNIHGSNCLPVHSTFLVGTLNSSLFPIAFSLPDNRVFVAANRDAMIYDWQANTEQRLPQIPNGVRVTYPMIGTAVLLPLSPDNDYTPEILLCGGIVAGWQVEQMPAARTMPDAVLLPSGDVVLVNGAGSGISGYGNVRAQVGASNANNPVLSPVLYRPAQPTGARFDATGMPASDIPRLYHSVATLTPRGDVMIAGSNPNLDRSEVAYGTEYRVEWLSPPYMGVERPVIASAPRMVGFGLWANAGRLQVTSPESMQGGEYRSWTVTHAVHANARLVYLKNSPSDGKHTLSMTVRRKVAVSSRSWMALRLFKSTDPDQYGHAKDKKTEDGSE
ncbi:copper radical oxidase [Auriscalpium vulgare]|uniref:Copper radical oxidase n=1 Tax=Auriscalpium vulgare TaxID=40419 RepID=A0ACB8RNE3_9AGAM|nr:copper radical oxidase [Auriscalpium vulgare]